MNPIKDCIPALPSWLATSSPYTRARLQLLHCLMRWPQLIVPCASLYEYAARPNRITVPGVPLHTADFGLTSLVLGDGPDLRAGFHHVSRAILGIEAGIGWLPLLPETAAYRYNGAQLSPSQLHRVWSAELAREQRLARSSSQTKRAAEEVLLAACYGVSASREQFAALAQQVVAESERYREEKRRIRNED